jgi:hypothetical protein
VHSPWVLIAPCADFDGDGTVRIADVLYIIQRYRTGDLTADLDGDGLVRISDVLVAIAQYRLDCPETPTPTITPTSTDTPTPTITPTV